MLFAYLIVSTLLSTLLLSSCDSFLYSDTKDQTCEMEPRNFVRPSDYDVFLSDVGHNDLMGPIAERLEVKYLEEQQEIKYNPQKGIEGILYGTNLRPMINLVVSSVKFKKPINVVFMFDTGSPCVYICEKAMAALGFSDHFPQTFMIDVGGIDGRHEVVVSGKRSHFSDINLIGATFLKQISATITANYKTDSLLLSTNYTLP